MPHFLSKDSKFNAGLAGMVRMLDCVCGFSFPLDDGAEVADSLGAAAVAVAVALADDGLVGFSFSVVGTRLAESVSVVGFLVEMLVVVEVLPASA